MSATLNIISDTSCFILLTKIGELDLLEKVYGSIITTPEVAEELNQDLPYWVEVRQAKDSRFQQFLETQLGKGESAAIALAIETPGSRLILDDKKARDAAEKLGLLYTGTLGVLIKAKLQGIIPSVKPLIGKIRLTDFRLSAEVERIILEQANE